MVRGRWNVRKKNVVERVGNEYTQPAGAPQPETTSQKGGIFFAGEITISLSPWMVSGGNLIMVGKSHSGTVHEVEALATVPIQY